MGWKQCTTAFPGDLKGIEEPFETLFKALRTPLGMALFGRRDHKHEIYLLTPEAAQHSSVLGGEWIDVVDPSTHGWELVCGNDGALRRFGLQTPFDRKRATPVNEL